MPKEKKVKEEAKYTPMLQHFLDIKKQYQNTILLYRMGDFYETFFEDASLVSKELNIVLTKRHAAKGKEQVPMAGVPYHALDNYLSKLVNRGYKVAICEQMEKPSPEKKLVRREVIRVITPGTLLENQFLVEKQNNYLCAVSKNKDSFGLAYVDISTGEFKVTQVSGKNSKNILLNELARLPISECLLPSNNPDKKKEINETEWENLIPEDKTVSWFTELAFNHAKAKSKIMKLFKISSLEGFGLNNLPLAVGAAGAIIEYVEKTQMSALAQFKKIENYSITDFLIIDNTTKRNLELFSTSRDNLYQGSLLSIIDDTKTAMGGRLLRAWLLNPLLNLDLINKRQDSVEELVNKNPLRMDLRELLGEIRDIERIASRIAIGMANPKDMIALSNSINTLPSISQILEKNNSNLSELLLNLPKELIELGSKIELTMVENPPHVITEGKMIRENVNDDLDKLKSLVGNDKTWLAELERNEKETTGIKSLKISFNKSFGYYIEVSNTYKNLVPENYIRKQTLVNAERYITPELKEREGAILSAEDKIKDLEYKLFCDLRNETAKFTEIIQNIAYHVSRLDVLTNLSEIAVKNKYIRPKMENSENLIIKEARHPVIEELLPKGKFVANDVNLNTEQENLIILTGPNMAGKSTFMRQLGLIIIMAQMGAFIPAKKATIGICDRVFTRVGAVDDLSTGQSTFMVEMNETANILNNATNKSFILLDEVGRGTSTFDGVSIAWAVSEYIVNNIKAKTIFATHYHELNKLEKKVKGVKNFQVSVQDTNDKVVFLHKVIPGGASKSYGIEVAKLAGLPKEVIKRSKGIMSEIEKKSKIQSGIMKKVKSDNKVKEKPQLSLFDI